MKSELKRVMVAFIAIIVVAFIVRLVFGAQNYSLAAWLYPFMLGGIFSITLNHKT